MNKLREILENFITEDDTYRKRVSYDLSKTLDKYEKKIRNLKLKEIVSIIIIGFLLLVTQPCQAVMKCYKDICVGDTVLVIKGIYKGNLCNIVDILRVSTPEEEEEEIKDYYNYFVSLADGTILELYRNELK